MARKKDTYYSLDRIKKENCPWNILYAERSPGKSYAVKLELLKEAWTNQHYMLYLRRWREEIKVADIIDYFEDMVCDDDGNMRIYEITNGEYTDVTVWMGKIWFANLDEQGRKIRSNCLIGYYACLTGETHYKSKPYVQVYNMVFEEFITDKGYLPREPIKLMQFVSTVFRRREGKVYLIGNTITRNIPYFAAWGLDKCLHQQQGTILKFHMKSAETDEDGNPIVLDLAVEYCKRAQKSHTMIFGKGSESMVTGQWDVESYLSLPKDISNYKIYYTCYAQHDYFKFKLDTILIDENPVIYISRVEEFPTDRPFRLVSNIDSFNKLVTHSFKDTVTRYDNTVYTLLSKKKVAVEDNLCGTDFFSCYKFV